MPKDFPASLFSKAALIFRRWFKLLGNLALGQGVIQLLQIVIGFVLIRSLSVEDYAVFAFCTAILTAAPLFVEMALPGAIIANAGKTEKLPQAIHYARIACRLRWIAFSIFCAGFIAMLPWMGRKFGLNWEELIIYFVLVSGIIWMKGYLSIFRSVFQVFNRPVFYQHLNMSSFLVRLPLIAGLLWAGMLYSITALLVVFLGFLWFRLLLGYEVRRMKTESIDRDDATQRKELLNYSSPLMPGLIFTAFQSQVLIFLAGVFGSLENTASMGALYRLGHLFLFLQGIMQLLLPQLVAKQKQGSNLFRIYLMAFTMIFGVVCLAPLMGWLFHKPLLWLLGPGYQDLKVELFLYLLMASLRFGCVTLWQMNAARNWIFWWLSPAAIMGVLIIQGLGLLILDLSNMRILIGLGIAMAIWDMVCRLLQLFLGWKRDRGDKPIPVN